SYKFGVPVLVLFISVGMLAGSEGLGGIVFNNPASAQFIGIVALNFILFSGGLDTDWKSIRPIFWRGLSLSTAGVVLTAGLVGVFVWAITDFSIYEGLLLGAIVSSTDSAAVFSILRSKNLALKGRLRPILELESGSNDPMAYILVLVFTSLVMGESSGPGGIVLLLLSQLILGALLGFLIGKASAAVINRIHLDFEGLYIVLMIAVMFFAFSFTDFIGGNGFLAVYLAAIYLGNSDLIHKKKFLKSFDSFAWLMQVVLFLTLGLLVFPSQIVPVIGIGLVISAFLMLVARPFSVFASLSFFPMQARKRLLISWVGLRGAVPIVFATYPLLAGAEKANMIFNLVFFISITSVMIQGTTLSLVARWLHLLIPEELKQRTSLDRELEDSIKSLFTQITIPQGCPVAGKQIVQLGFPRTMHISFIRRKGKYITPNGSTTLQEGDQLFVLSEHQDALSQAYSCLNIPMDTEAKPTFAE
ncbi:MAG TPA: potassium/proton antiporter, partial [Bacteroidales bacterium]|nr:potassium/proton antiporter [Bacteroidales bacterium]